MTRRHGSLPLYIPPEHPSEEWTLAEQMASPITVGSCTCHALCTCDTKEPEHAAV